MRFDWTRYSKLRRKWRHRISLSRKPPSERLRRGSRIFASPYVAAINDMVIGFLAEADVETVSRSEVGGELVNYGQGELDPQAVYELGLVADHPDAEALVLSCTDMHSVEIIARLEAALGKPVIISNQAMAFQAAQLAGISEALPGYGQLLERKRLRHSNRWSNLP